MIQQGGFSHNFWRRFKKKIKTSQILHSWYLKQHQKLHDTYGPKPPATTFICCWKTFWPFWILPFDTFLIRDHCKIAYISIWSVAEPRFFGSRAWTFILKAPGPVKLWVSIFSPTFMRLPDPSNGPKPTLKQHCLKVWC